MFSEEFDGSCARPAVLVLSVQYPPQYPDEAPRLDLSAPPNAAKYQWLDIQDDKARLLEALQPTIEENLGMAMVFTLVSALKDGAEVLIAERQKAVETLREVERRKAEEEENAKFHGTPVTRETFMSWRAKFMAELEEEERKRQEEALAEDKKRRGAKDEVRLTGKQLWERGLVGKVDEVEDGDDALDALEKLKVEAA